MAAHGAPVTIATTASSTTASSTTAGGTVAAVLDSVPELAAVVEAAPTPTPTSTSASPTPHHGAHLAAPTPHHGAHLAATPAPMPERRRRWPWVALAVIVLVIAAVVVQLGRTVPALSVQRARLTTSPVAGVVPALPWPATGEAAVAVPQLGVLVGSGVQAPVPIASLTKIMTAYLTLREHPLAPGDQGQVMVMTAADQAEAATESAAGATNVPVQAGERLTERQLLDGLLVHSANNFADVLADWDAGTIPAFVAKMNGAAAALGMVKTHYADASGLDPASESTVDDQLRLTEAAMAIPMFATVVSQPSVTLPIAGVLENYVKSVGTAGIVGVKSGFTQAAMGCLVLAGERIVAGHRVLVLAAVTGQPGDDPLDTANQTDMQLLDAATSGLRQVPVTPASVRVASVTTAWSPQRDPVVAAAPVALLAWPGQVPRLAVTTRSLRAGLRAGTRVGRLSVSVGHERVVVPVRVTDAVIGPTVGWRLARS